MTEDLNVYLGQVVRRLRRERELTQGQLADRVGLTRTSVTNIEKGRQALSVSLMVSLARGMSTDPVRLLKEALRAVEEVASRSVAVPTEVATGVASPELLDWVLEVLQHDGEPDHGRDGEGSPAQRTLRTTA